jgi:hypothetical protein
VGLVHRGGDAGTAVVEVADLDVGDLRREGGIDVEDVLAGTEA